MSDNSFSFVSKNVKEYNVLEKEILSDSFERKFSPMDRSLRRELKSAFGNSNYWFSTSKFKNAVEIKVKSKEVNQGINLVDFLSPLPKSNSGVTKVDCRFVFSLDSIDTHVTRPRTSLFFHSDP